MVIKDKRNLKSSEIKKGAKRRPPVIPISQQYFLILAFTSLLLIFIVFISNLYLQDSEKVRSSDFTNRLNYGVIVDCGSSGTRAHIFRWKDRKQKHVQLLRDKPGGKPLSMHITPGLSSFKDEPDKASDYIQPIMKFISESIPQDRHPHTPIYFLATAGMRLLDDTVRDEILRDVSDDILKNFNFSKVESQVISGSMEGVYSWLSLNIASKFQDTLSLNRSYGMLELGGASTQITYELDAETEGQIMRNLNDEQADAFRRETVTVDLGGGKTLKLFATTFLGLGVNSAREAAIDLLVKDYNTTLQAIDFYSDIDTPLKDPCLNVGSRETVYRPRQVKHNSETSIGLIPKQGAGKVMINLEGEGNFTNCLSHLRRTLQIMRTEKLNCPYENGSCPISLLSTNFIPYHKFPFIGLSEFFFTTNEMMNLAGPFDREKVMQETKKICTTGFDQLSSLYSKSQVTQKDRILYECFKASWLLTILYEHGFNMPQDYRNFQTVEKLDGKEIDWTIGAMISEVALNTLENKRALAS